jgi:hypothetical protein
MSVNAGIQTAHRTDSHGHRPQNSLTCSNIQIRHFPVPTSGQTITHMKTATRTCKLAQMLLLSH